MDTSQIIYDKIMMSSEIQSELYPIVKEMFPHSQNDNGLFLNISLLSEGDLHILYEKILKIEGYISLRESHMSQNTLEVIETPTIQPTPPSEAKEPFTLTKTQSHLLNLI